MPKKARDRARGKQKKNEIITVRKLFCLVCLNTNTNITNTLSPLGKTKLMLFSKCMATICVAYIYGCIYNVAYVKAQNEI